MSWLALLAIGASAAPQTFHPGRGADVVEIDALGRIAGTPVTLTGTVLVRTTDPDALRGLPEVAELRPLRGRRPVFAVRPAAGVEPVALARALHARADVAWAHPDLRLRLVPRDLPDDTWVAEQWHLQNTGQYGYVVGADLNVLEAWDITRGAGQLVAVLDTGIDSAHPDLTVTQGHDYVDGDDDSNPAGDDPHGTACAGLAVGRGDNGQGIAGVAYEGDAYAIRIIGYTSFEELYDAFVEAVDAGATVLSNSWGFDQGCAEIPLYGAIEDAMDYAEQEGRDGRGAAIVFAAGNGNCDITLDGLQEHPAVVSVAASSGWDVREGYSSFGPWVDITAPSGRIATTDITGPLGYNGINEDYTDDFNGTSASAPQISGVFALMFAANERLTAAEARAAMCASAIRIDLLGGDWDETGWSPYYGCGRVDAGAAVRAVANLGGPEAPLVLGPKEEAAEGAVLLSWTEPVDPDGDRLTYRVRAWYPDYPESPHLDFETDRPWLSLEPDVAPRGAVIAWTVRAVDPWGAGPASVEQAFSVVAAPPEQARRETGGCASGSAAPSGLLALLGAGLVPGRRRRQPR